MRDCFCLPCNCFSVPHDSASLDALLLPLPPSVDFVATTSLLPPKYVRCHPSGPAHRPSAACGFDGAFIAAPPRPLLLPATMNSAKTPNPNFNYWDHHLSHVALQSETTPESVSPTSSISDSGRTLARAMAHRSSGRFTVLVTQ
jgi:hypothetical protein